MPSTTNWRHGKYTGPGPSSRFSLAHSTGPWYDTRLGRQWRVVEPRQRRALVLIAMANARRGTEGRLVDEGTELLLTVTQYFVSRARTFCASCASWMALISL